MQYIRSRASSPVRRRSSSSRSRSRSPNKSEPTLSLQERLQERQALLWEVPIPWVAGLQTVCQNLRTLCGGSRIKARGSDALEHRDQQVTLKWSICSPILILEEIEHLVKSDLIELDSWTLEVPSRTLSLLLTMLEEPKSEHKATYEEPASASADLHAERTVAEYTVWRHVGQNASTAEVTHITNVLVQASTLAQEDGVLQARPPTNVLQLHTQRDGPKKTCLVYVKPVARLTSTQTHQLVSQSHPDSVRLRFENACLEIHATHIA
jgi:hypothetical protein